MVPVLRGGRRSLAELADRNLADADAATEAAPTSSEAADAAAAAARAAEKAAEDEAANARRDATEVRRRDFTADSSRSPPGSTTCSTALRTLSASCSPVPRGARCRPQWSSTGARQRAAAATGRSALLNRNAGSSTGPLRSRAMSAR